MTNSIRNAGLAALAFSLSIGLIGATVSPAHAAMAPASSDIRVTAPSEDQPLSARVPVRDLDLSQPRDSRRLTYRLRAASRTVCAPISTGRMTAAEENCRRNAFESTRVQVAALTAQAVRLAAAGAVDPLRTALAVVADDQ